MFAEPSLRFVSNLKFSKHRRQRIILSLLIVAATGFGAASCRRQGGEKQGIRPKTLRDVPAGRLAYQFTADTAAPAGATDDSGGILPAIQKDFDANRQNDALLRTAMSPDQQRVLVVYATAEDERNEYRLDLYGTGGEFQRHITPAGLAVVFAPVAAWSPDGSAIAFIGYRSTKPQPSPTPLDETLPGTLPEVPSLSPTPTPTPLAGPVVPLFNSEQIYVCGRDGLDLKPLTLREGLIHFFITWSPDSHALVSLACRETEWRDSPLLPAGRPRLIGLDGTERLLDDALTDVLPVWSPDASKVATAIETEVRIYDALTGTPSQAIIPLQEQLLEASRAYDEKEAAKTKKADDSAATTAPSQSGTPPISFNPIVSLDWRQPDTLYLQTGYVRNFGNEQKRTWMRWHLLKLSAQAALLG